jgi:hypothetical protein
MFDFLGMRTLASGVFSLFLVLAVGRSAFGQVQPRSLDNYVAELKAARSLSTLCQQIPAIKECMVVIGDWTPDALELAKMKAPICYDQCMLDVFGFYKDSETLREIPAVRTKDFDASAPSRGFEITFYPVALSLFAYEGCAGCSLIFQYPIKLVAKFGGNLYPLPMVSRGGFYIPSGLRQAILRAPALPLVFQASTSEGQYDVNISSKALAGYVTMLHTLRYDLVL